MYKQISQIIFIVFIASLFSCESQKKANKKISFNYQIRPILSDKCFACHGPDHNARKADLRFDIKEFAYQSIDSLGEEFAIIPGDPIKSHLVMRVESLDPEEMMPPPESNLVLTEKEKNTLKQWIAEGAQWEEHWSFIPPAKHDIPLIEDEKWSRNTIDNFVMARMKDNNLRPADPATKEKLIRRLSFDLRGIPPSLAEIDSFLLDNSSNAYEKLVDKYLGQEHFGERIATNWLDIARYADSHGYQDDIERSMWPWRDWVIDAVNKNMPYDSFLILQLAGDLLPDANYKQKLATGFNRNHMITQEVGVIDEEYRVQYVVDRVNTFSTGILGMSLECARCHDHKYDPVSQKEYYQLYDFFNRVPERGRVDYGVEVANPSLPLPEERKNEIKKKVDFNLQDMLATIKNHEEKTWNESKYKQSEGITTNSIFTELPDGLSLYSSLDYKVDTSFVNHLNSKKSLLGEKNPVVVKGKFAGAVEFCGNNNILFEEISVLDISKPFTISFWMKSLYGGVRGSVLRFSSDKVKAMEINLSNNKEFQFILRDKSGKKAIYMERKEPLPVDKWVHVAITSDGSHKAKGIEIILDGKKSDYTIHQDDIVGSVSKFDKITVGQGLRSGQLDELQFYKRELTPPELTSVINYNPIEILNDIDNKNEDQLKRLHSEFLFQTDEIYNTFTSRLAELKIKQLRTDEVITKPTMVMQDIDTIRNTFILQRGQYDAPGEQVFAGTPKNILPFDDSFEKNRLGLAKWLFEEENPLTARVAVNRYWQIVFGTGIVATPEDFGSQGAMPTHPELLDWLSVDFRESGWDVKRLVKKMVMSSTYKQSSFTTDEKWEVDPENKYLSRMSRARLPAELVRDNALSVSGLLNTELGGPSVKPYQPEGLWLETASGNQSLRKYMQDHGSDLYRKSLYTFWKRTTPFPSMMLFDASTRNVCIVRRQATTTPLQALVLLNDPQYLETSRLLGMRMIDEGGDNIEDGIKLGFRLATSRIPEDKEVDELKAVFEEGISTYQSDISAAEKLLSLGEYETDEMYDTANLAAYTMVANTILNLTETISK